MKAQIGIAIFLVLVVFGQCTDVDSLPQARPKQIKARQFLQDLKSAVTCDFCEFTLFTLRALLEANSSVSELESFLTDACVWAKIKSYDRSVCEGAISTFGNEVVHIALGSEIDPSKICTHFGFCQSELANPPPKKIKHNPQPKKASPTSGSIVRVLHISDLHYDPNYLIGSESACSEPLCCRFFTNNVTKPASPWGDYNCDIPKQLFTQFLEQVSSVNADVVLWTGDNTPHDIWEENAQEQLDRIQTISGMVGQYFHRTPVFPALGNHDSFPVDQMNLQPEDAAHYLNYDFLLQNISLFWSNFLGPQGVQTFQQGGYYSRLAMPGLRVFAMNSFWGDTFNFYLLLKDQPQDNQWTYLRQVLQGARYAGEKVLIIGHIPSGLTPPAIYSDYGDIYVNISREFSDVIVGHFYGHTHNDQFEIIFDEKDAPIGVSYIAPSCTTFTNKNPSYRIYDLDSNTFEVLDYHQYYTDLSQLLSGKVTTPVWSEAYSMKSEYSMSDLSPSSFGNLVENFETNDALFQKWYYHYYTQFSTEKTCTGTCKTSQICSMKASGAGGDISCELK